jgi:hypothetical protein
MHSSSVRRFAAGVALVIPLLGPQRAAAMPPDVRTECDAAFAIVAKTAGVKTRRSNG